MIKLPEFFIEVIASRSCYFLKNLKTALLRRAMLLVITALLALSFLQVVKYSPVMAVEPGQFTYLSEENIAPGGNWSGLAKPVDPYPVNQAGGITSGVQLKWETGLDESLVENIAGLHYVIYFGTADEMDLAGAVWPWADKTGLSYQLGMLEADTNYYWQVAARDSHGSENRSSIWSFNTFGVVSGRVTMGEAGLPDKEVAVYRFEGEDNWIKHVHTLTDENGYYLLGELPAGDYLVKLVQETPRFSGLLAVEGGYQDNIDFDLEDYDFQLLLNEGWNLVSLPRWAEDEGIAFPEPLEDYVESWMTFWEGEWEQGDDGMTLQEALNNPTRAVYINVLKPMIVSFRWAELTPELKYASQQLYPGWNLVSSSYEEDYRLVFTGLADFGHGGISHISVPNEVNGKKGFNYHLPWQNPLASIIAAEEDTLPVMYPLDGYWVQLNGDPVTYTTMVSAGVPEQKIAEE